MPNFGALQSTFSPRLALACLAVVATLAAGCDSTQQVPGAQVLDSKLGGSIQGSFLVSSVKPSAVAPGDEAAIEGFGLTDDIAVLINDQAAAVVRRDGDRTIVFKMPAGSPGMQTIVVRKGSEESSHPLVRLSNDGSPVLVGGQPDQICKGEKFFTLSGDAMEGERNCTTLPPPCLEDGQTDCVASHKFPAADRQTVVANVLAGATVAGIAGQASASALPACKEDGDVDCLATSAFPAADAAALAPKVKAGETVAGVAGTYVPDFPDPANVAKHDTVNGLSGLLPDCSADGATGCVAVTAFPAADKSRLAATDLLAGKTIAGITGTATPAPPSCAGDNGINCVATASFPSVDKASLAASDIRLSKTVAGIAGSLIPAPAACATDGATGCVAVTAFPAVDATRLDPGNIRRSVVLGAVTGDYPSATHPLEGADSSTTDLPGLTAVTDPGLYEWFQADGTRLTGSILDADGGSIDPGATDQEFTAGVYRAFTVRGDSQLTTANIRQGIAIFGVQGTAGVRPPDCTDNFSQDCVATATYQAADLSNLSASNLRKGIAVAGLVGDYPSAAHPLVGNTTTPDLQSLDQYAAVGSFEFFDSAGNVYSGSIADGGTITPGTADTTIGGLNTVFRQVIVRGDPNLVSTKIRSGTSIFGVDGDVVPLAPLCSTDAETGCTTTASFKAADMSGVNAGNIRSGVTIAGIEGGYPSSTYPLIGSSGVDDLPQLDQSMPAGQFEYFDSTGFRFVATVADGGTVTPTTSNQTIAAASTVYRRVVIEGDTDLLASNIASGTTLFGVPGTATLRPADCAVDGATDCVATATFKAADMTAVSAATVRSGYTIAGVAGDFPSAAHRLTGSSATSDLPSLDASTAAGSYEWFLSDGSRSTGTIGSAGTVVPGTADQSFDGVYAAFTVAGATTLVPGNIADGVQIFGVTGSAATRPADCNANALTGCVTTTTYRSADLTNLDAGNIRNGVSLAGVAGQYPSATHPLAGDTGTTDLPSLAATVAAGSYEWFLSDGTRASGSISDAGTVTPGTASQPFTTSVYRQFTVAGDPDLTAGNIMSGVDLFGVSGSFSAGTGPSNCSGDGQSGCVVTDGFVSASSSLLLAGNIRAGVSVGGVTGSYPSSATPLAGSDTTSDLTSAGFSSAVRGAATFEWFDQTGARYTRTGDTDLVASNVRTNVDIFGVTGTVVEVPNVCTSDGEVGCVTSLSYKSAAMANVAAGNVRNGVTIAGVTGTYPSATTPLAGADSTSDLTSGSFTSSITSAASFEWFDASGTRYTRAGDSDLATSNIRGGIDVFGLIGTVTPAPANCAADGVLGCVTVTGFPSAKLANFAASDVKSSISIAGVAGSLAPCSADAQTSCVANDNFKAADMVNNAVAGKIKSGAVIAGVTGAYPSATYKLASDTATPDLPALGSAMALNTYEYWQADGTRRTGTIADQTVASTATTQTVNAATTVYRTITVTGDPDLVPSKILSPVNILGVVGSVTPAPANCATDGATNCVATASFKAADMTRAVTGNIKSGQTLAGVTGSYGPACSTDGQADCVTVSTSLFRAANVSGIQENIRAGTTIAGVVGGLKLCRNTAKTSHFNRQSGTGATSSVDPYDTIDDLSDNGSAPYLPPNLPFSADYACNSGSNWQDKTADGSCSYSGDNCVMRDTITQQYWYEEKTNVNWEGAITYCENLSATIAGGTVLSNWRVPTQKEMLQGYINGFRAIKEKTSNFYSSFLDYAWTATTNANSSSQAWIVVPGTGNTFAQSKTSSASNYGVWCVHD